MAVKTLTIDGKHVTAADGETILAAAREAGIAHPDALPPRRPLRRRRLPAVPGRGRRQRRSCRPSCVTSVAEGMDVHTDTDEAARVPPHDRRAAVRRAQPRLLGLRGQRQLRAAGPGRRSRRRSRPLRVPVPAAAGGRQPRAVRHRPQPLHPLHPLRPGLRRDRGGAHLGRGRPRHATPASSPT